MSCYFRTIPKNLALIYKTRFNLDIFVETGTYAGITSEWAARHFQEVHTIEQRDEHLKMAEARLMLLKNVFTYLNDSRLELPCVLQKLDKRRTLLYLDAHWANGAHYGRPLQESTALEEILIINQWNNRDHVIFVDDAHRFGTERWPGKIEIVDALHHNGRRNVRELLDVLIAAPGRLN